MAMRFCVPTDHGIAFEKNHLVIKTSRNLNYAAVRVKDIFNKHSYHN